MKCIQIFKDGKMDELEIKSKKILNNLINSSKSQGNDELIKLYSWNFEGSNICCYGWYDGVTGFENSHDLPHGGQSYFIEEDSSEKILYGDIFIVKYHGGLPVDITISDYSVFYSDRFENFSDYSSDNEGDIENNDIIIENDLEDTEEIIDNKTHNDDLEYDNYEY